MTTEAKPDIPTPVRVWGHNGDHLKPHRCTIRKQVLYGFLTLHYDPQDLRVCLRTGDKRDLIMRLPWPKLALAHELDGAAVMAHFDETTLDGEVVDRTLVALLDTDPELVRDPAEVRRKREAYWEEQGIKPKTLRELAQELHDVFETDEEREEFAESIRDRHVGSDANGD